MKYTVVISCTAVVEADSIESAFEVANEISMDASIRLADTLIFETEVSTIYPINSDDDG